MPCICKFLNHVLLIIDTLVHPDGRVEPADRKIGCNESDGPADEEVEDGEEKPATLANICGE